MRNFAGFIKILVFVQLFELERKNVEEQWVWTTMVIKKEITASSKQVVHHGGLVKSALFPKDLVSIYVFSDTGTANFFYLSQKLYKIIYFFF